MQTTGTCVGLVFICFFFHSPYNEQKLDIIYTSQLLLSVLSDSRERLLNIIVVHTLRKNCCVELKNVLHPLIREKRWSMRSYLNKQKIIYICIYIEEILACRLNRKHEPSVNVTCRSFASLANVKLCCNDPVK